MLIETEPENDAGEYYAAHEEFNDLISSGAAINYQRDFSVLARRPTQESHESDGICVGALSPMCGWPRVGSIMPAVMFLLSVRRQRAWGCECR